MALCYPCCYFFAYNILLIISYPRHRNCIILREGKKDVAFCSRNHVEYKALRDFSLNI